MIKKDPGTAVQQPPIVAGTTVASSEEIVCMNHTWVPYRIEVNELWPNGTPKMYRVRSVICVNCGKEKIL